jgi:hypothetical protein
MFGEQVLRHNRFSALYPGRGGRWFRGVSSCRNLWPLTSIDIELASDDGSRPIIYSVPEKEPETKLGSAVSVNLG